MKAIVLLLLPFTLAVDFSEDDTRSCSTVKLAYKNKCNCLTEGSNSCIGVWNPSGINYYRINLQPIVGSTYVWGKDANNNTLNAYMLNPNHIPHLNNPNRTFHGITHYTTFSDNDYSFVTLQTMKNFVLTIDGRKDTQIKRFCDDTELLCDSTKASVHLIESTLYKDTIYEPMEVIQRFDTLIFDDPIGTPNTPITISFYSYANYDETTYPDVLDFFRDQPNLFGCWSDAAGKCLNSSNHSTFDTTWISEYPEPLPETNPSSRRRLATQTPTKTTVELESIRAEVRELAKQRHNKPRRRLEELRPRRRRRLLGRSQNGGC